MTYPGIGVSYLMRQVFKATIPVPGAKKEEAAAEVMISTLTYLQRIGCKNIEQLLKDTIERHARQNE